MDICKKRRVTGLFAFMLFVCAAAAQQYSVTGGSKAPILAVDDKMVQVYLVYGTENLQISYTSSSTSHKWYRYKTRVNDDAEEISSVQTGNTSVITEVGEEYGYYVIDESVSVMNRYYVWVVDYSKYEFDIRSMSVSPDTDQCFSIRFEGDADVKEMIFYDPVYGTQEKVRREFELSYETVKWNEELSQFFPESFRRTFNTELFSTSFTSPLVDTEIVLTGDMFARHFGVEKSISVPYQAVAIDVHADTVIISSGSGSGVSGASDGELQAPATVSFRAHANIPVASLFTWKIFRDDDPENPILIFAAEEFEYTFDREGSYTVKLEVSDRSGSCTNDDEEEGREYRISITETEMVVPNAFSPGTTPGINDIFKVRYKSVMKFQGWVFNRWGNELFHWTDPTQGWDGKYRGKYVPPGAYYYLIEYTGTDGKKRVKKGDINVFRSKSINTEIPIVE